MVDQPNKYREEMQAAVKRATTPLKAIKEWCLECSGDAAGVKECPSADLCPLWKYRKGTNPKSAPHKPNTGSFAKH